jgi:hypothetical protein
MPLVLLLACASSIQLGDTPSKTPNPDTGAADSGISDGPDTGTSDSADTGALDTGNADTGNADTGTVDSAEPDATDCFGAGLLADASHTLDGGTTVDGYTGGVFEAPTTDAQLAVNGTAACAASVSGAVDGGLWTGGDPDAVLCLGYGGAVSGAVAQLAAPLALPDAAPPELPSSAGPLSLGWGTSHVLRADTTLDSLSLQGSSTLTVEGDVRLRVLGSLQSAGTIALAPGARLRVWVDGGGRFEWGSAVNPSGDPASVTLYALGADDVALAWGAAAAMRVVHPGGRVNLEGGALTGAVAARELRAAWGSSLHVDMSAVCADR